MLTGILNPRVISLKALEFHCDIWPTSCHVFIFCRKGQDLERLTSFAWQTRCLLAKPSQLVWTHLTSHCAHWKESSNCLFTNRKYGFMEVVSISTTLARNHWDVSAFSRTVRKDNPSGLQTSLKTKDINNLACWWTSIVCVLNMMHVEVCKLLDVGAQRFAEASGTDSLHLSPILQICFLFLKCSRVDTSTCPSLKKINQPSNMLQQHLFFNELFFLKWLSQFWPGAPPGSLWEADFTWIPVGGSGSRLSRICLQLPGSRAGKFAGGTPKWPYLPETDSWARDQILIFSSINHRVTRLKDCIRWASRFYRAVDVGSLQLGLLFDSAVHPVTDAFAAGASHIVVKTQRG